MMTDGPLSKAPISTADPLSRSAPLIGDDSRGNQRIVARVDRWAADEQGHGRRRPAVVADARRALGSTPTMLPLTPVMSRIGARRVVDRGCCCQRLDLRCRPRGDIGHDGVVQVRCRRDLDAAADSGRVAGDGTVGQHRAIRCCKERRRSWQCCPHSVESITLAVPDIVDAAAVCNRRVARDRASRQRSACPCYRSHRRKWQGYCRQ